MENKYKYSTVASAINALRKDGFTNDFNLFEDHIACEESIFKADDIKIKVVYRYEGNSDPADEATVYGLESKSGLKGILVLGAEIDSNSTSAEILKKLHLKKLSLRNN